MNRKTRERLVGYAFIAPDITGLIIFAMVPAIVALVISFFSWNGLSDMLFVGLDNYRTMFQDPQWRNSIFVTLKYSVFFVPLNFVFALLLAMLVQKPGPGIGLFRAIFFAPTAMSMVAVSFVWKYMFQPYGFVNYFLSFFGITRQPLLGSMSQALYSIAVVSLYMSVGYYMVIFLAGLNEISNEYYEAAEIDGASGFQKFLYITLPLLKPTTAFVLVMTFLQSFQVFDQIYILTGGGPFYSTSTAAFYIYYNAFQMYQFGYSSAQAFTLFAILLVVSYFMLRALRGGNVSTGS
ncbi:sugar ABC transporter permease [Mesotoga prima]|uniref:carbohydrate ABC transporter permease n=1 Tax=Mesotoga prima TaxID=1184387 RepID=UPI002FD9B374